jgi:hypothetical protein
MRVNDNKNILTKVNSIKEWHKQKLNHEMNEEYNNKEQQKQKTDTCPRIWDEICKACIGSSKIGHVGNNSIKTGPSKESWAIGSVPA